MLPTFEVEAFESDSNTVVWSVPDGLVIIDPAGDIRVVSFGRDSDEVIGENDVRPVRMLDRGDLDPWLTCGHGWIGDDGECGGYDAATGTRGVGCGRYFDIDTGAEMNGPKSPDA